MVADVSASTLAVRLIDSQLALSSSCSISHSGLERAIDLIKCGLLGVPHRYAEIRQREQHSNEVLATRDVLSSQVDLQQNLCHAAGTAGTRYSRLVLQQNKHASVDVL